MAREIELRAHLTKENFDILNDVLKSTDGYKIQKRCFIDYSTYIGGLERTLDVRCRITNGHAEVVVKKGGLEDRIREESMLPFELENTEHALHVMSLLGYNKGVSGCRKITKGHIGNIEIQMQEAVSFDNIDDVYDRFIEVEYLDHSVDEETAIKELEDFLGQYGLEVFEKDNWFEFLGRLNKHANGLFTYGETPVSDIIKMGTL